jgi:ferritin-like metal-binding protein YciE
MKLSSLQDLFARELQHLYSAEKQILSALPRLVKAVSSPDLQDCLQDHLEKARQQITRLERIFKRLGLAAEGKQCKGIQGLLEESEELMSESGENSVIDAGLIAVVQKVKHYEIAAYGSIRAFADRLGQQEIAELLEEALEEEKEVDQDLSEIAMGIVNEDAATAGSSEDST